MSNGETMNTTINGSTNDLSNATPVIPFEILGDVIPGPTEEKPTRNSPKHLARIAGILYLLVGIFGGFAQGFVYPKMYIAGDATTTTTNLIENSGLVRTGIVADLFQATVWVFVAMTLYQLLKHVNKSVAGAMVILAAIGSSITCLNTVFEFEALRVATGAVNLSTFDTLGSSALALLLTDAHHYGLFIAQIFFGLWLVPLGYLAYKSGWFPRALGIALVVTSVSYLLDLLAAFLFPEVSVQIHAFLSIAPTIAEPWMVGYLLLIGVKTMKPARSI